MIRPLRPTLATWGCALVGMVAAAGHSLTAAGAAGAARSGAGTVALVELYASEGCDSCPPADRWLAATFRRQGDAARAIPLAFHVDYWDRLGRKDRLAPASSASAGPARPAGHAQRTTCDSSPDL